MANKSVMFIGMVKGDDARWCLTKESHGNMTLLKAAFFVAANIFRQPNVIAVQMGRGVPRIPIRKHYDGSRVLLWHSGSFEEHDRLNLIPLDGFNIQADMEYTDGQLYQVCWVQFLEGDDQAVISWTLFRGTKHRQSRRTSDDQRQ